MTCGGGGGGGGDLAADDDDGGCDYAATDPHHTYILYHHIISHHSTTLYCTALNCKYVATFFPHHIIAYIYIFLVYFKVNYFFFLCRSDSESYDPVFCFLLLFSLFF